MPDNRHALVSFRTDAADSLLVTRLDARESVSSLYRFELDLVSPVSGVDHQAVLRQPASVGIREGIALQGGSGRGVRQLLTHGIVVRFEQGDRINNLSTYRATLVPRMWRLTQRRASEVYLQKTVPQIVASALQDHGLVEGEDFEFRLSADYPQRDYVVQYEETDYDFVSRWLEHEGIFFFFDQKETGEKIIFADASAAWIDVPGVETLNYRPGASEANMGESEGTPEEWLGEEVVTSLRYESRCTPERVQLKDYNWRNPADALEATAPVEDGLHGTWREYNANYRTSEDGARLAALRADELRASQRIARGRSDCRAFRPGVRFRVADHFRPDFNADTAIIEVRHRATQTVAAETGNTVTAFYANEFVAVPAAAPFRPARTTPWPRIRGAIHAVIDSSTTNPTYADIDADGSYRVRLPWDVAGADHPQGAASRHIRLATPYAGAGFGANFPLLPGTEVLLTHIDGHPDRPVIAGALHNRATPSPVNIANRSRNMIRSAAGNMLELDDTRGQEGLTLYNGSMSGIQVFRNTTAGGAGGSGGPGGLLPPINRRDANDEAERVTQAVPSSPAATFSSRVGLFAGALANLSVGGEALLPAAPAALQLSPGGGAPTAGADTTGGDDAPETAEDMFFAANGGSAAQARLRRALDIVRPGGNPLTEDPAAIQGNGEAFRTAAGSFSATIDTYSVVEGDELEYNFGHSGEYIEGTVSSVTIGPSISLQRGNVSERTEGHVVSEQVGNVSEATTADTIVETTNVTTGMTSTTTTLDMNETTTVNGVMESRTDAHFINEKTSFDRMYTVLQRRGDDEGTQEPDAASLANGEIREKIFCGDMFTDIDADKVITHVNAFEYGNRVIAGSGEAWIAAFGEFFFGLHTSLRIALSMEVDIAGKLGLFLGTDVHYHAQARHEISNGPDVKSHFGGTSETTTWADFKSLSTVAWIAPTCRWIGAKLDLG
ncbi:MAG: type VI secretion system Vgr family protein [Planctomycetota bacterium]